MYKYHCITNLAFGKAETFEKAKGKQRANRLESTIMVFTLIANSAYPKKLQNVKMSTNTCVVVTNFHVK